MTLYLAFGPSKQPVALEESDAILRVVKKLQNLHSTVKTGRDERGNRVNTNMPMYFAVVKELELELGRLCYAALDKKDPLTALLEPWPEE